MSTTADLPTTSYAILGLLAIRPWTTYELAQQMDRSLKHFWPRAQSRIYEEPKRLAALGLVKATADAVGRRPRTVYSITAKGRRALAAWLTEPGEGPVVEFEALLKVFSPSTAAPPTRGPTSTRFGYGPSDRMPRTWPSPDVPRDRRPFPRAPRADHVDRQVHHGPH